MLNAARALQGAGGAAMFATALALLAQSFQGADRGTAFGAWGATTGGAVAIGPLLGGVLTDWIGWESIFFINVPIGALALWATFARVGESRDPSAGRVDVPGTVLFSAALFCLVFALIRGNPEGWSSTPIVVLLVASAVLLLAFVAVERTSASPMLDLALFRKPAFVGASIGAFALSAAMFAMFLYLTLYIQNVLGYSPLEAGLRFLPVTLLSFAVGPVAGRLSERYPIRWFLGGGLALIGCGLLLMRSVDPGDDWTALLAGFMICGGGIGLINPPLASAAVGVVPPRQAGMGSGINSTFRQVGIATGIAGLGAVFQSAVADRALSLFSTAGIQPRGEGHELADFISFGGAFRVGDERLARIAEDAFVFGLDRILLIAGIVALVGALLCAVLTRQSDFIARGGVA